MRLKERIIKYVRSKGIGAESIRYIIVGVLTTVINYAMFELMQGVIGIDVTVSNVASISVSILFAYITNKHIVFRRHSDSLGALALEFLKFVASRLFTMALEVGIVYLFHNVLGYSARLFKLIALVFVIVVNYILSKVIVFSEKK
ncbi:MAG: GtrA family protein [Oscillospiraceae bacterium]|nr:GtrA family protein [Oscillospiraceae bacterium]